MANIPVIEAESIQVGRAPVAPIAAVDLWPSLDPTVPFTLQSTGINNFPALTNQIGVLNSIGLQNVLGALSRIGFDCSVGGKVHAEPASDQSALNVTISAAQTLSLFCGGLVNPTSLTMNPGGGFLVGSWKLNGVPIETTSDARLKTNITPLQNSLDKILQLQGVEYDRTDYEKHEIGMVAQEVEKIIPDLVKENSEGVKILEYQNLTAVLVEAIKEQQEQINSLKQTVQELSTKLENCCP